MWWEMGEGTRRRARREPHSGKRRPVWTASPQKTGPKWICKGLVDLSTISNGSTALVIGWDEEMTVQVEGIADETVGPELDRLKTPYFAAYPDGARRQSWPGITYFRVRPTWARYSDFHDGMVVEFTAAQLNG